MQRWVAGYERAWRTPGVGRLSELFSPAVCYRPSPWQADVVGLAALGRFWEAERDGPDEEFTLAADVVAIDGSTAVLRLDVDYADASVGRWRDLWVLGFADDGRCRSFEEWPFAPGQSDGRRGDGG